MAMSILKFDAVLDWAMKNVIKKTCSSENFSFITFCIMQRLSGKKFKALE